MNFFLPMTPATSGPVWTALGLPERLTTSAWSRRTQTPRESIAWGVWRRPSARIASAIPGMTRSPTASVASGVRSRGASPVPPVVTTSRRDDQIADLVVPLARVALPDHEAKCEPSDATSERSERVGDGAGQRAPRRQRSAEPRRDLAEREVRPTLLPDSSSKHHTLALLCTSMPRYFMAPSWPSRARRTGLDRRLGAGTTPDALPGSTMEPCAGFGQEEPPHHAAPAPAGSIMASVRGVGSCPYRPSPGGPHASPWFSSWWRMT